jgi:hypothetical protein
MTTLHEFDRNVRTSDSQAKGAERRKHRRHDLETQNIRVERWQGRKGPKEGKPNAVLGTVVDLSSGGVRIRTTQPSIRPDQQIRLKLELPVYAGICPFVDTSNGSLKPRNEWVGWMAVSRVQEVANGQYDVAGRLVDMEELDRGMLGLYLSTQPMAA